MDEQKAPNFENTDVALQLALTAKQLNQLAPLFGRVLEDNHTFGIIHSGALLAQPHETGAMKVLYVPFEYAERIRAIIQEYADALNREK